MKNFTLIVIVVAIVIAGCLISGSIIYVNQKKISKPSTPAGVLSAAEVGQKAIAYINENILKSQNKTASLDGQVVEEGGVYKLTLKIGDQTFPSYVTLDGKLLFPDFIDMTPPTSASDQNGSQNNSQTEIPKTDKPKIELFVMAFCPYGNQAEDIMNPVFSLMGSKFDFVMHYIVSKDDSGKYQSLHGDQELHQDVRELCVAKYQNDKSWSFIEAINKNCTAQNADTCWEKTASDLGIDVQKIKDCQSAEASSLLDQEISAAGKYGVTGSPQLFINGVEYKGDRTSEAYKQGICSGFNTQPTECSTTLSADASASAAQGGCGQ